MTQVELQEFIDVAFNNEEFKIQLDNALQEQYKTNLVLGDANLNNITNDPSNIVELIGPTEFKYLLQRHQYQFDFITLDLINTITDNTITDDLTTFIDFNQIQLIIEQEIQDKTRINKGLEFEIIKDLVHTTIQQYGLSQSMDLYTIVDNLVKQEIIDIDFVLYDSKFDSTLNVAVNDALATQLNGIVNYDNIKQAVQEILQGTTLLDDTYSDIDDAMKQLLKEALQSVDLRGLDSFQVEALITGSIKNFVDNHVASRQIINYVLRDHKIDQWICEANYDTDEVSYVHSSVDPNDPSILLEDNVCACDDDLIDPCDSSYVRAVLTADNVVAEGEPIEYQIVLSKELLQDITIELSNGSNILIEAGSRMGWNAINTDPADDYNHDKFLVVSMQGYVYNGPEELQLEYSTVALTKIKDDMNPVILEAYYPAIANNITDGGLNITFTISEIPKMDVRLLIDFSKKYAEEVIIPAGELSTTVTFQLPADSYFMSITALGGGDFEDIELGSTIKEGAFIIVEGSVKTIVSIAGPISVTEGSIYPYTLDLGKPLLEDVTVYVEDETFVIYAGMTTVTFSHQVQNDYMVNSSGLYSLQITNAIGGGLPFGDLDYITYGTTTASLVDQIDTLNIGIAGLQSDESDTSITFELTLSSAVTQDLTVEFADGSSTLIQKGANKKLVSVPVDFEDNIIDTDLLTKEIINVYPSNITYSLENYTLNPAQATVTVTETINPVSLILGHDADLQVEMGTEINYSLTLTESAKMNLNITLLDGQILTLSQGNNKVVWTAVVPETLGEYIVGVSGVAYDNNETLFYESINTGLSSITYNVVSPDSIAITFGTTPAIGIEDETISTILEIPYPSGVDINVKLDNQQVITIPAGTVSLVFDYIVPNDFYITTTHDIEMIEVTGGSFSMIDHSAVHTISVTDVIDDTALSITSNKTNFLQGESILITASLTTHTRHDLTITLNAPYANQGVITIPAFSSTGSVVIDSSELPTGEVSIYVESISANDFENLINQNDDVDSSILIDIEDMKIATIGVVVGATSVLENVANIEINLITDVIPTENLIISFDNYEDVIIEANLTTGVLTIPVNDEDVYFDPSSVQGSITSVLGGGYNSIVIDPNASSFNIDIIDTIDETEITLLSTPNVTGDQTIDLTVTLGNLPLENFSINVQDSNLNDYPFTFTPIGSLTQTIQVTPLNSTHELSFEVETIGTNDYEAVITNTTNSVTNVTEKVYIHANLYLTETGTIEVNEGSTKLITFECDTVAVTDINFTYYINSIEYDGTISAGSTNLIVDINIDEDDVYLDSSTLNIGIKPTTTGGGFDSLTVNTTNLIVVILDTIDYSIITLNSPSNVQGEDEIILEAVSSEAGSTSIVVTIQDDTPQANEYTIVIPSGAEGNKSSIPVSTTNSTYVVTFTVIEVIGGNIEAFDTSGAATSTIVQEVLPHTGTFTLTGVNSATEGDTINYTLSVDEVDSNPISATITLNGDSNNTLSVILPANTTTVDFNYNVPNNVYTGDYLEAELTHVTQGGYEAVYIGNPYIVYTSITDIETKAIATLSVNLDSIDYDETTVLTITLSEPAKTPVKFLLDDGTLINILQNASTGSVMKTWEPTDANTSKSFAISSVDDSYDGSFENLDYTTNGSVIVTINPLPNYVLVLESPALINETESTVKVTISLQQGGSNKTLTSGNITFTINGVPGTFYSGTSVFTTTINTGLTNDVYESDSGEIEFNVENIVVSEDAPIEIDQLLSTLTTTSIIVEYIDSTILTLTSPSTITESATSLTVTATTSNANKGNSLIVAIQKRINNGAWETAGNIIISDGETTGTLNIDVASINDVYVNENKSIDFQIASIAGGTYEDLIWTSTCSTTITDNIDDVKALIDFIKPQVGSSTIFKNDLPMGYEITLDVAPIEDLEFGFYIYLKEKNTGTYAIKNIPVTIAAGQTTASWISTIEEIDSSFNLAVEVETYLKSVPISSFENMVLVSSEGGDVGFDVFNQVEYVTNASGGL